MTRKKVKLAFIANDSSRKATYKKRKKGMLKKIEELSTLCGIEACAIVYGPDDPEPEVWPSEWGVQKVLGKFRTMPEMEQSKKMVNQESFTGQRIVKGHEQMMKLMKENREKELTMFMFQWLNDQGRVLPDNNMTVTELSDLSKIIDENLTDVSKKLENLNVNEEGEMQTPSLFQPPQMEMPAAALVVPKSEEMTMVNYGFGGLERNVNPVMMQRHLIMDLANGNNGVETMIPPFGAANNLHFQPGFWPNLGI